MPETYKSRYGYDWPPEFSDTFIDMTVAKKWRLIERQDGGRKIGVNPGDCLESALRALFADSLKISPWASDVIHDFAIYDKPSFIGCGSSGKSHVMAACAIAHWATDPYDTAVVVGSSTLVDLKTRAWAPMTTLFAGLKAGAAGVPFPGKIVSNAYAIVNERDESNAASVSARASIQGRALDEGRVQGLHVSWVLFIVDELALIKDLNALSTSMANARIGTLGFKVATAANPEPWDHPNSKFYLPPAGVKVDDDTGEWMSALGYHVRHFDGLKSPVVKSPALKDEFPFLMSKDDVDEILKECDGDVNHPRFWKMVRGFPLPNGRAAKTVLDPVVGASCRACQPLEPPVSGGRRTHGRAAGADPAWSEGGDDAIYAGVEIVEQDHRVYLDFSGLVTKMPVSVKSQDPVTKQLREATLARMREHGGPTVAGLYVDASGNQGLADDIDIYVGPGCGHINASVKASEYPIRALDSRKASEHISDRGAETWFVLAEFCKAGQVRGLPQKALDALCQRRLASHSKSGAISFPHRLEAKEEFIKRFRGSPNEADACALAALAAKERLGIIPFGGLPSPQPSSILPQAYSAPGGAGGLTVLRDPGNSEDFDDHDPDSGEPAPGPGVSSLTLGLDRGLGPSPGYASAPGVDDAYDL